MEISLAPLDTESGVLVSAAVRDISERLRLQRDRRMKVLIHACDLAPWSGRQPTPPGPSMPASTSRW